jgi:hypothetical protein
MRYIDHPDQDLNTRAFQKESGRLKRVFGKSDPPPAPDYTAAANATAAGNLEAARYATEANRINQYTPYGSLEYTRTPTGSIDYNAYNRAMDDYNRSLASYNAGSAQSQTQTPLNEFINTFGYGNEPYPSSGGAVSGTQNRTAPIRPELESFRTSGEKWSQTMRLTPEAQSALDQQLALNRKYGEVANLGFDRARTIFENPELDTSLLPERAINVGQTAQQALMARLQPQLMQQEESMRARLANQGIGLGSEAYGREQALAGQRRNDLELQAALQGINLDQANRSAALQEQAYLQDRPLNLINALRTGNQVQAPQFQQFAQQATTAGPDILGATNAQYQAAVDATNAQNAAFGNTLGGLFSLGGTILGAPTGSIAGGLFGLR